MRRVQNWILAYSVLYGCCYCALRMLCTLNLVYTNKVQSPMSIPFSHQIALTTFKTDLQKHLRIRRPRRHIRGCMFIQYSIYRSAPIDNTWGGKAHLQQGDKLIRTNHKTLIPPLEGLDGEEQHRLGISDVMSKSQHMHSSNISITTYFVTTLLPPSISSLNILYCLLDTLLHI